MAGGCGDAGQGTVESARLISHRLPLSKGVEALEMMRSRREAYNRVVLINEGAEEGERQ